ncbi:heme peroxidase family protein [soil metagenome]
MIRFVMVAPPTTFYQYPYPAVNKLPLGRPTAPEKSKNDRTPALDLDSIYGGGPIASSHLYESADQTKLRVESGGMFEDLPRTIDNQAIIGDPRNDEHLIIAGLHAAFLLFHNRVVDHVREDIGLSDPVEVFAEARRITTWHYQWIIMHELLPGFVGQAMVDDILTNGRQFYTPEIGEAFIPVEFQGAAYRFGHSLVRPSYRANLQGDNGDPFFGMIFDPAQEGEADPDDLRGGCRAPRRFIDWQTFFNFGDGEVKPNKRIDTKISSPLFNIPLAAIPSRDLPTALAQRTLLRHITWLLPSGQAIAQAMGIPPLGVHAFDELSGYGLGLERSTPLWYYVLKEAEVLADGAHLGPVAGRIVGEVFIGLLQSDPDAYITADPGWAPTLPSAVSGDFQAVDLLTFAGVDPVSRGQ